MSFFFGCLNKMAVSVTGHRAVNELGGPVIPGSLIPGYNSIVYGHSDHSD